jgi:hypothetical protein
MALLTAVTEAARGGAAAVTGTEDALDEGMTTTTVGDLDLRKTAAITDREDDRGRKTTTDMTVTRTTVARRVPRSARARLPNPSLLRMSVTGEPYLSNNWPLASAPKS